MNKKVLSFGAGVQTTALAILVAERKLEIDCAIFADTGGEKPETYWYMETYIKPLFKELGIEFITCRSELPSKQPDLYGFLWKHKDIPSVHQRQCTVDFKLHPIKRTMGKDVHMFIGFSTDEIERTNRKRTLWTTESFPLIEMGLSSSDCQRLISNYGWMIPLKSSCFFCPFQPPFEWKWLKEYHPELFQKALDLEGRFHEKKPQFRDTFGIYRGLPLRHIAEGQQYSMGLTLERSCWEGLCGH